MAETYVLDTNIFVGYVRDADYARYVDDQFGPLEGENITLISIVSHGELFSLAYQFGWGERKRTQLQTRLNQVTALSIDHYDIIDQYAEIDAYSKGKLPGHPLPDGESAFKLGKNDLWIAATASVTNAVLLSTDNDFQPLMKKFIRFRFIDPSKSY